jgi:transcriptional/translational regulatory protein YebC/TACO1
MFEHKCHFRIAANDLDIEELELELIDYGAEELFLDEKDEEDDNSVDGIMIYAEFQNYGALQKALEEMDLEILSSDFEYIPTVQKELTSEQREDVDKLLEKLDEDDDVNNVYTTLKDEE